MKRLFKVGFCLSAACITTLCLLPSCKKSVNYGDYISENRKQVYLCKEDGYELKIFCSDRETPYSADGFKGNMTTVCEVYYKCENSPESVVAEVEGFSGEMSYMSVTDSFYLSFSADIKSAESLPVKLTIDDKQTEISARNVFEDGTIDASTALRCVTEYDKERFERLTERNSFSGEIGIRLLYDEGCYYYVSVCDREAHVKAYLVDGKSGRIITERETVSE